MGAARYMKPATPLAASTAGRGASSEALAFGSPMRTTIYVDGFNLYYGALRRSPYKWLDLRTLFDKLLQPHREILGHFLSHKVTAPLANPAGQQRTVESVRTEEKGSDVNLAVHLLNDGWLNAYDCAVVVTNDSDIAEAMRLVGQHLDKRIGLITPGSRHPSRQLLRHADFARRIRRFALENSQLPNPIPGTELRKPAGW